MARVKKYEVGNHYTTSYGYYVSLATGTISYGLTLSEYDKGNITELDMAVATYTYLGGLPPGNWPGYIPGAIQVAYDLDGFNYFYYYLFND